MKKEFRYTHWLKIEDDTIEKVWINLAEYKEKYKCNVEVFYRQANYINKVIKLECNQSYKELDLDVNSMSDGSLTYLAIKPKNICKYSQAIEEFFRRNIRNIDEIIKKTYDKIQEYDKVKKKERRDLGRNSTVKAILYGNT